MKKYKLVVYIPEDHADKLREAMGNCRCRRDRQLYVLHIYNERHRALCTGRRLRPAIGGVDKLEEVAEDRIEAVCNDEKLRVCLKQLKMHTRTENRQPTYILLS